MAIPDAKFVGLSSADPEHYDLPRNVGIKLNDKDIGRAKELLKYRWFQRPSGCSGWISAWYGAYTLEGYVPDVDACFALRASPGRRWFRRGLDRGSGTTAPRARLGKRAVLDRDDPMRPSRPAR